MGNIEKLSYCKITNWKLFNLKFLSREEIYNEQNSDGEAFQINVTQDYYNREFNNVDQNNL